MKRAMLFIVVALCLVLTDKAHAQRALPGMRGIQVTGGMVDGVHWSDKKNELGYYFGLSMATYTKHANKWVFGGEYLKRYYPYKDGRIPVEQFTAEGGYYPGLIADGSKTFFISLGTSALAGYETVNGGDRLLYDGATLRHRDKFLYGGAITLEMEAYLTDRLVLLLNVRERILGGSSINMFHTQIGAGFKCLF